MMVNTNSLTIYTIHLMTLLNFSILYSKTDVMLPCLWNFHLIFGYISLEASAIWWLQNFHSPECCLLLPHLSTCPWPKSFLSFTHSNFFLLIYHISDSLLHTSHSMPGNTFSTWFQHLSVCLTVQFEFSSSSLIYILWSVKDNHRRSYRY